MAKETRERRRMQIKKDLHQQLKAKNLHQKYWYDLVDDYLSLFDNKEKLKYELAKNGVMITVKNGTQVFRKKNDAIVELPKISKRMTDILLVLNIQSQDEDGEDDDDDY
ncbi:hypothetical protein [Listeria booriae]|uniref:hypothetical protein n=1 Tax=Listeria booriae TaxID=1552123 RepID=UPI001625AF66|nr:hypothetical protein [Listeria booriae]MBC2106139.1 hypothetical protein [Listeria booriae]